MKESEREAARWMAQAMDDYRFVQWLRKESRFFDTRGKRRVDAKARLTSGIAWRRGEKTAETAAESVHRSPLPRRFRPSAGWKANLGRGSNVPSFCRRRLSSHCRDIGE